MNNKILKKNALKFFLIPVGFLVLIFFLYTMIPAVEMPFDTLKNLKEYAAFYPEAPKSDTNDWIDPEFVTFYHRVLVPSSLKKILIKFRLSRTPVWNAQSFKDLLIKLTKKASKKTYLKELSLSQGDRCFIWGDLHGAFHSIVRALDELKSRKIINDNLKIIADNVYFVILGDTVSRSPYSLELLHVLLVLLDKNKDKFFFLRGNHESRGYWKNFSMGRALKIRASDFLQKDNDQIPLGKEVDAFFGTLPSVLKIKHTSFENEIIFCAHSKVKKSLLTKNVKALVLGEKRLEVLKETKGLEFIGYDRSAAQWSILSCPIGAYQKFFNFYYDVFLEMLIGATIGQTVLTVNNQDVRNKNGFKQKIYDITFGYELKDKKSKNKEKKKIHIGSSMSLSGVLGTLGRDVKHGAETAIYDFNNKKNNPFLIEFVVFDDSYVPRITRKNVDELMEKYDSKILLHPIGSPTLSFYLDMVRDGKIAVLFPYTGAPQFRKEELKNLVHFRPAYTDEVQCLIDYMVKDYGIKKFAFFYQADAYGTPPMKAAHAELKKLGITKWIDLPYITTQKDFKSVAKKIKEFKPEAIGCFSIRVPTQELIEELGTEFFIGTTLFGISPLYNDVFRKFLDDRGVKFIFSSILSDPLTSNVEIIKKYRKAMDARGFSYNTDSLESYISGSLFIDAIEHVSAPFTKEKIINYFENMINYKFKGLSLTFDPKTRGLTQPIWVLTIEGKWLQYNFKENRFRRTD